MKLWVSPSFVTMAFDSEMRAFDMNRRRMTLLSGSAAMVAELADGSRTEEEILKSVVSQFGSDKAEKCRKWIRRAIGHGWIVDASRTQGTIPPDVGQIADVARELQWNGDPETAFWLQRYAAQNADDDARQWLRLGEIALAVGRREIALQAYERYASLHPDDAEILHVLKALRHEPPPERASDDCIIRIYDRFASFYESNMCQELKYEAPEHLESALRKCLQRRTDLVAADLGCGTGLFGVRIRPMCAQLTGVDLSPAMIGKARERAIYDRLECLELTCWLNQHDADRFDLIACCDTLIYFGDLTAVTESVAAILRPGGLFGFTLEKCDRFPFELGDSGRFRHDRRHVREAAEAAGLQVVIQSSKSLRREYGKDVEGIVTVAAKPLQDR